MPGPEQIAKRIQFWEEFFSNNCGQVDHSLSLNFCLLALPLLGKVWTSTNGNQIEGEIFEIDQIALGCA